MTMKMVLVVVYIFSFSFLLCQIIGSISFTLLFQIKQIAIYSTTLYQLQSYRNKMESKSIMLFLFIIFLLTLETHHSKSIVKSLPGFSGDLPFTFETGYVGLGEDEEVQVFYYFVESERNPQEDPLLFYFPGGPGTSGLYSFLYQMGPLNFNLETSREDNITLELNPYSWTKMVNMLFVDLPVGVGFSYGKTWEATRSGDSLLALQGYDFIRKWLVDHPKFLRNPLYISGISYMGILIPIIALKAYNGNEREAQPQLNIKGCLMISPLTDKFIDFNSRFEYAHRLALISDDIYESAKKSCDGNYINIESENALCLNSLRRVDECTSKINLGNILEPFCDPESTCEEVTFGYINVWANDKAVQKALNVREGTIGKWEYTNSSIRYYQNKNDSVYYAYDIFSSVDYHKKLVSKNCQVLIISGDHDMIFPYVGMEKWISTLNLTLESAWEPWFVNNQIAGYQMTYADNTYSLKFATAKGAGHAVPLYMPEECLFMVDRWLASP